MYPISPHMHNTIKTIMHHGFTHHKFIHITLCTMYAPHLAKLIPFQVRDSVCGMLHFSAALRFHIFMDCGRHTGTVDELAEVVVAASRAADKKLVHASTLDTKGIGEHHFVLEQPWSANKLFFTKDIGGCCVAGRWKREFESVELDHHSAGILDSDIGQAIAEHVFACARRSKKVAISALGAIVAVEHDGCKIRRLGT